MRHTLDEMSSGVLCYCVVFNLLSITHLFIIYIKDFFNFVNTLPRRLTRIWNAYAILKMHVYRKSHEQLINQISLVISGSSSSVIFMLMLLCWYMPLFLLPGYYWVD